MNQLLTTIKNKVTSRIFNKKSANPNPAKVSAGDVAEILYDLLEYTDALPAPLLRYTVPFGPQTSVQVPFVKQTTVSLLRKFGEVATLQYRIGAAGTLTAVTFTANSATPNLVIPAGSYLELLVGWGSLPSGKGAIYLEATEV